MNERRTLQDIIDLLAEQKKLTKKDAELFLRELVALISETIEPNDPIRIKDFGTFKLTKVNARKSVDVNTGEPIEIAAHYRLSFAPDKSLRDEINKPFAHFESVVIEDGVDFDIPAFPQTNEDEIDGDELEENEAPTPQPEKETKAENKQIETCEQELILSASASKLSKLTSQGSDIQANETIDTEINTKMMEENKDHNEDLHNEEELAQEEQDLNQNTEEEYESDDYQYEYESSNKKYIYIGLALALIVLLFWGYRSYSAKQVVPPPAVVEQPAVDTTTVTTPAVEEVPDVQSIPSIGETKLGIGQTLRLTSLKYYGHKIFWVYIYEENKDKIKNPNNVPTGLDLTIPSLEKYKVNAKNKDDIKEAYRLEQEILNRTANL